MATTSLTRDQATIDALARQILASNGVVEPHPALLADTIREVEYHGVDLARAAITEPRVVPAVAVVKEEWEQECQHPYCSTFHQAFFNEEYLDRAEHSVPVYDPKTDLVVRYVRTRKFHSVTRTEWIVLRNGVRDDSLGSFNTRREARAAAWL